MKKQIIDLENQTEELIDLLDDEIVYRQTVKEQLEAEKQAEIDLAALKTSAKAKLIAGEPLTAAEADTLVI